MVKVFFGYVGDFEPQKNKIVGRAKFDKTTVDKSFWVPQKVQARNVLQGLVGGVNNHQYDFSDGKDDGRNIPLDRLNLDMSELSQIKLKLEDEVLSEVSAEYKNEQQKKANEEFLASLDSSTSSDNSPDKG